MRLDVAGAAVPTWNNRRRNWAPAVLCVLYLYVMRLLNGAWFSLPGLLLPLLFVAGVIIAASLSRPIAGPAYRWQVPIASLPIAGVGLLAAIVYGLSARSGNWLSDIAAWVMLAALFVLLLALDYALTHRQGGGLGLRPGTVTRLPALPRWLVAGSLALLAGALVAALAQIEARFSEEEFYAAVEALALAGLWLLLRAAVPPPGKGAPAMLVRVNGRWLVGGLLLGSGLIAALTLVRYRASFYPTEAPPFDGISASAPFVCGTVPAAADTYAPAATFDGLLGQVAEWPLQGPPELGLLALGSSEQSWANEFRESLLGEARAGRFTAPAGSVKFGQYEAALRAYYYPRVRSAFPELFSAAEQQELAEWFAAINQRAMSVEWVDWMYALALDYQPRGPYENQENGAGLLALLQAHGLSAPSLALANRDYLAADVRGWPARFRNSDDALVYQPEWLHNAYFLSLLAGQNSPLNQRLSFEWLLLQALPDGASLGYNHVFNYDFTGIASLGARLLGDERLAWLAGRSLAYAQAHDSGLAATPGAEEPLTVTGQSPVEGSCLLYGESGAPTQDGHLGPDKIVMRDGWEMDSSYLLLNLRFTGWHRYKATGAVSLVYQAGPLVVEEMSGSNSAWLPAGRQLFRDKRVPRQNLNGLLVARSGLGGALYQLAGLGTKWGQDPPHYAQVEQFDTGPVSDVGRVVLRGWRGWQHEREVRLYHQGPILVLDNASGPAGRSAALTWHFAAGADTGGPQFGPWQALVPLRLQLRTGAQPAQAVVVPLVPGVVTLRPGAPDTEESVLFHFEPQDKGALAAATIFLTREWESAEVEAVETDAGIELTIDNGTDRIQVLIER